MTADVVPLSPNSTQDCSQISTAVERPQPPPPQSNTDGITQASSSTCPSPPARPKSASPTRPSPQAPQNGDSSATVEAQDGALQVIDLGPVVSEIEDTDDLLDPLSNPVDAALQEEEAWDHDLKRVKVYELMGSAWIDQGTAFCCGSFEEDTGDALLIARAEGDHDNIILSTTIRPNDVYQQQQETLIVWTEPDGTDYALSFQEAEGCLEVWNFILEVQRYLNGPDQAPSSSPLNGTDNSITTANIIRLGHLPQPALGIIGDIDKAIKALARTQAVKERLCEYIQREGYIKSMVEVMDQAEDLESIENLHALCLLMQTILMLNDHSMYEHILDDKLFFGVVGMLEYDPEFPVHKANYRDFLKNTLKFHCPIPIADEAIQKKIHHAYRLVFLKDVVLVRVLDDSTFNVLNSCIIFNQIDIISYAQTDGTFLSSIVKLYVDEDMLSGGGNRTQTGELVPQSESTSEKALETPQPESEPVPTQADTQMEVVLLIQQLCVMGKNVQLPTRLALFRSLVDRGILFAVQWALTLPPTHKSSQAAINAGGEIFSALLEHDLLGVRAHVIKQIAAIDKEVKAGKRKSETLLMALCRVMSKSTDMGAQCLIGDSLKAWLDTPLLENDPRGLNGLKQRDDAGTEKFLDSFYDSCVTVLFEPFKDIPEWKNLNEPIIHLTRERANLYLYLCELLHMFEQHHTFRSQDFLLKSDISLRVATLLKAKDKHLRHAAFRFFRAALRPVATQLRQHFMARDIFRPILELTLQECKRDSLLSSACQDFFETIRRENIKDAINHCMKTQEPLVRKLADAPLVGPRFQLLIRRWEMNNEPPPELTSPPSTDGNSRKWPGNARRPEAEEEDYFNADDDEDDDEMSLSSHPSLHSRSLLRSSEPTQLSLKRKRKTGGATPPAKGYRPSHLSPLKTPSLSTLVDYGEDEEDPDFIGPVPDINSLSPNTGGDSLSGLKQLKSPPSRSTKPNSEDNEDNALEALVQGHKPTSPPSASRIPRSIKSSVLSFADSPRTSEKRRRDDEDDEEEPMVRLRSQTRKRNRANSIGDVSTNLTKNGVVSASNGGNVTRASGDDTPRRIKVKFGAGANALAQSPTTPSDPGNDSSTESIKAEESKEIASPAVSTAVVKDRDTG